MPSFQTTPRQYGIVYNQLSRTVVYTEGPAQNMKMYFSSVLWGFLFFNAQFTLF
jgi:hypothetical protein